MKSIYLLLSLLALFSCQRSSSWELSQIESDSIQYFTTKLSHPHSNDLQGIELEFFCMDGDITAFLNIFSSEIPATKKDPLKSSVIFYMDGIKYEDQADRLRGGQRVRLSPERTAWLIKQLQMGKVLEVRLRGYRETIHPENFPEYYQKLTGENHSFWSDLLSGWKSRLRGPL